MTQEQIEEMLRSAGQVDVPSDETDSRLEDLFTSDEQDALGEMGNICMGTAATTMYTLLGKQVQITTPSLSIHTWKTLALAHPLPLVVVEVQYTRGLDGNNLLLLKEYDVALITDLLIGGDGNLDPDNIVLDEISLSAIREVMNQMVGSSSTSLASMLQKTIDISTPVSRRVLLAEDNLSVLIPDDAPLLKIAFKMEIEGLLESEIMQILPVQFAKKLANDLLHPNSGDDDSQQSSHGEQGAYSNENVYVQSHNDYIPDQQQAPQQGYGAPQQQMPPQQGYGAPQQQMPPQQGYGVPQQQMPPQQGYGAPQGQMPPQQGQMPPQGYPPQGQMQYAQDAQYGYQQPYMMPPQGQMPQGYPPYGYPPYGQPPYGYPQSRTVIDGRTANAKEVQYPEFESDAEPLGEIETENIKRLMDVPMEITVDLGRVTKSIRDILELNVGSVVVLNKQAGELVEIMVNGIQIARGEVVVIDDSYGVRLIELNMKELSSIAKK